MNDPFGSMQSMIGQFRGFMQNPMQFMAQRSLNIPQQYSGNANQAIQYLMNNGKMSQQQYNQLRSMTKQIQQNPMFRQMMGQ